MFVQKTTKKNHDWNVFISQLMAERVDWVQHCMNSAGGSNVHVLTFAVWYFFSIWIVVLRCGSPSIQTDEGPRWIGPLKFSRSISVVFFYSSRSTLSLFNTHTLDWSKDCLSWRTAITNQIKRNRATCWSIMLETDSSSFRALSWLL